MFALRLLFFILSCCSQFCDVFFWLAPTLLFFCEHIFQGTETCVQQKKNQILASNKSSVNVVHVHVLKQSSQYDYLFIFRNCCLHQIFRPTCSPLCFARCRLEFVAHDSIMRAARTPGLKNTAVNECSDYLLGPPNMLCHRFPASVKKTTAAAIREPGRFQDNLPKPYHTRCDTKHSALMVPLLLIILPAYACGPLTHIPSFWFYEIPYLKQNAANCSFNQLLDDTNSLFIFPPCTRRITD